MKLRELLKTIIGGTDIEICYKSNTVYRGYAGEAYDFLNANYGYLLDKDVIWIMNGIDDDAEFGSATLSIVIGNKENEG